MSTPTRFQQVVDYANPYLSAAYEMDAAGHGWDRLWAIAGEFERGEIDWATAVRWCDDNERDLLAMYGESDA